MHKTAIHLEPVGCLVQLSFCLTRTFSDTAPRRFVFSLHRDQRRSTAIHHKPGRHCEILILYIMKTKHVLLALALVASISYSSHAQIEGLPNPSPSQTVSQDLGLGKVSVTYSRPNVKGREIFGALVPYGKVWRAGANAATTITLTEDVLFQNQAVPAGQYALFCIPGKDQWTIVLNKTVNQWGAYLYDAANDQLRIKVKPVALTATVESFTIQFANVSTLAADLRLEWNRTQVSVHLTSNDDARILANIDRIVAATDLSNPETLRFANLTYFDAIQYYYNNNKDTEKALQWIGQAENAFPKRASYRLFRSRFLLRKGDKAGARTAAEAAIKIARETNDDEYLRLSQEALNLAR